MTMEKKINMATAYTGISQAELARKIGMTPQNFNLKIRRETLKLEEIKKIAEALGAEYSFGFTFPDGTKI